MPPEQWPAEDDLPIEELARRQSVKPVASLDELARPDHGVSLQLSAHRPISQRTMERPAVGDLREAVLLTGR